MSYQPYSYRHDPNVPDFPDGKPIIIFDGHCAFCSGWARFVLENDREGRFRLMAAQSPTGTALYKHYGLDPENYETNILIENGIGWFKSEGSIRMAEGLGYPWSLALVFRALPLRIRDWIYEIITRNRFRIRGRLEQCFIPTEQEKSRFLT